MSMVSTRWVTSLAASWATSVSAWALWPAIAKAFCARVLPAMTMPVPAAAAPCMALMAAAIDGIVFDAPSTVADTASLLNPADALQSLGNDAAQMGARAQQAAEATFV